MKEQEAKGRLQELESAKEDEVRAAYQSLQKAEEEPKMIPIEALADETGFPLQDHQKHSIEVRMLYGDVYLGSKANCQFGPFSPPRRASQEAIIVVSSGGYELLFQFISSEFLKLRIPREMVYFKYDTGSHLDIPSDAPEVFEFVGIWRDQEKEKAERRERFKAHCPPSPRESWFELHNSMDW
ncbi:hypothetical protein T440DRAFT_520219 [Plenodomus tracheiphilus IPT5]|uniref:Uncharacterized protein n=1 Tax=Plenodomus tracheiphilus IPT5 TaxID=1408161 RepID=A0A6A7AZ01_9PLEO|nr:hypothetical protein T440DRAFT_520219 [Plenodomus tracheiphilus IPT5]